MKNDETNIGFPRPLAESSNAAIRCHARTSQEMIAGAQLESQRIWLSERTPQVGYPFSRDTMSSKSWFVSFELRELCWIWPPTLPTA